MIKLTDSGQLMLCKADTTWPGPSEIPLDKALLIFDKQKNLLAAVARWRKNADRGIIPDGYIADLGEGGWAAFTWAGIAIINNIEADPDVVDVDMTSYTQFLVEMSLSVSRGAIRIFSSETPASGGDRLRLGFPFVYGRRELLSPDNGIPVTVDTADLKRGKLLLYPVRETPMPSAGHRTRKQLLDKQNYVVHEISPGELVIFHNNFIMTLPKVKSWDAKHFEDRITEVANKDQKAILERLAGNYLVPEGDGYEVRPVAWAINAEAAKSDRYPDRGTILFIGGQGRPHMIDARWLISILQANGDSPEYYHFRLREIPIPAGEPEPFRLIQIMNRFNQWVGAIPVWKWNIDDDPEALLEQIIANTRLRNPMIHRSKPNIIKWGSGSRPPGVGEGLFSVVRAIAEEKPIKGYYGAERPRKKESKQDALPSPGAEAGVLFSPTSTEIDLYRQLVLDTKLQKELLNYANARLYAQARATYRGIYEPDLARDAVQDAYAALWEQMTRPLTTGAPKPLRTSGSYAFYRSVLQKLVENAVIDIQRMFYREVAGESKLRISAHLEDPIDEEGATFGAQLETYQATPEEEASARELVSIINEEIEALPDNLKQVIIWRDVKGWRNMTVAEKLDISPASATGLHDRAILKLRDALQERIGIEDMAPVMDAFRHVRGLPIGSKSFEDNLPEPLVPDDENRPTPNPAAGSVQCGICGDGDDPEDIQVCEFCRCLLVAATDPEWLEDNCDAMNYPDFPDASTEDADVLAEYVPELYSGIDRPLTADEIEHNQTMEEVA